MASTYTADLRLNKQGIGDNNNTWGTIVNTQLDLIDDSVSGQVIVNATTGSDITLSTANGTVDEARKMIINISGTPINDINIIVPAVPKIYIVNAVNLSGTFSVTVKPVSGNGVAFETGECGVVACDGTDIIEIAKKSDPTPTGTIVMFKGTIAAAITAYPGWEFCNGGNGTPDLRDRFIVGARQDDAGVAKTNITGSLTESGGSTSTNAGGDHNHGGSTGSTVLTVNQIPSHSHTFMGETLGTTRNYDLGGFSSVNQGTGSTQIIGDTGGGLGHDHTISSSGTHTHTAIPPYYALVFLMKL